MLNFHHFTFERRFVILLFFRKKIDNVTEVKQILFFICLLYIEYFSCFFFCKTFLMNKYHWVDADNICHRKRTKWLMLKVIKCRKVYFAVTSIQIVLQKPLKCDKILFFNMFSLFMTLLKYKVTVFNIVYKIRDI